MNYGYTDEDIAWSARIAGFRAVVTLRERAAAVVALGLQPIIVEDISKIDPEITFPAVPSDTSGRILFSSGTTGKPKGAVYTHSRRWIGEQLLKAVLPFTPSPGSRILLMTPFSHGASLLTFAWCDYGAEVVLMNGVDTDLLRDRLRFGGIDAIFAPPTVLAKMAATFGNEHFPGVRCVFTGTQPLTLPLYEKALRMFGPVVRITFGKTECINPITVLDASDCDADFSSEDRGSGACVGWPASGVELRIHTEATPNGSGGTTAGEVWLRAPHMSNGLIDTEGFKPHEPDGWHRTGDQGHIDARGRLWLTGRIADEIKTGGYRVNPDEIESFLTGLYSCGPVCVTALPSEYWGEVIIAVAENAGNGWEAQAAERVKVLSRHKRPRAYVAIDALPRNHQGKVSRRKVSELVLATHDFIDGPYPSLVRQTIFVQGNLNLKKGAQL
jgi:malonyl-CoA/methylmalonyl-CoA synthetase